MNLCFYLAVLTFEVLYYSLFMKFAKREGKLWKYLLTFAIISTIGVFIGTNNLLSYVFVILMMVYGLKFITRVKVSLYDMLVIFIMLLIKHIMEIPFSLLFYMFIKNIYLVTAIVGSIKVLIICLNKNNISKLYKKMQKLWNNNNFCVRYIFTTFMLVYVIASCLYCIIKWL